jgi:diguanylate cyclase (GGDEF)-like protein
LQWLIAHLPSVYLQINADGNINRASHFTENLLGFDPGKLIGRPLGDIIANSQEQTRALADIIHNKGKVAQLKIRLRSNDSDPISLEISGYAKNDNDGKLLTIELFSKPQANKISNTDSDQVENKLQADTSAQKAAQASSQTSTQIAPSAQTVEQNKADLIRDPLTRLINHVAFEEHLAKSIRRARRHHSQLWVLFVSLQGFASTVQQHGEQVGRASLVQFSQRLQSFFRDTDIVASIEPGQFAILLDDYTSELSLAKLIGKLQKVMDRKVAIPQYSNGFSFSIGTANFPEDGMNSKDLIEHAQSMMFKRLVSKNNAGL